jgi:hypothetical protein
VLNTHITYIMNLKKIILFVWKHIFIPSEGIWRQSHWFRKKYFFFTFCFKKIFLRIFLGLKKLNIDKAIWRQAIKKIWAFSVKIKGISDIRQKRMQKCEKISPKPEQFSNPLPVWFFNISYFSHGVYISKNKGKIRNLQKLLFSAHEKCSGFQP